MKKISSIMLLFTILGILIFSCVQVDPSNEINSEKEKSSNATLSSLSISSGTLSPTFLSSTTNYTVEVGNEINTITITPTKSDQNATITINSQNAVSGSPSQTISLNVGSNAVTIEVTAEDGTKKSYIILFTRNGSSNANLSDIYLSYGTLSPAFSADILSYNCTVVNPVTNVHIYPTKTDSNSTIKINDQLLTNGQYSQRIYLNVGPNIITIEVTAQDNSKKSYIVNVTRSESDNARLSSLTISSGTLSPDFSWATADYTANVGSDISNLQVTPIQIDVNASIKVNDQVVVSGQQSHSISLAVGPNIIEVEVTAQDGTKNTYTITVSREASSNADLYSLTLSNGSLNPVFSSYRTSYSVSVENNISNIYLTPVKYDSNSTIKINNQDVASGQASQEINLNVGSNLITIDVIAQDNSKKTYSVSITRAGSSNAKLTSLTPSLGSLSPTFSSTTNGYTASVDNSVSAIKFTATKEDINSIIKIRINYGVYTEIASGTESPNLALDVGINIIDIQITAQDSSINIYSISFSRAKSNNANLSNLSISSGTLNPSFSSTTKSYTVAVPNAIASVTVTPSTEDSTAGIKVRVNGGYYSTVASGSASGNLSLNVGNNTIDVLVTAQDNTTNTYSLNITRYASSNSTLSGLTISTGTLSPDFSAGTTSYTTSVANTTNTLTVTPTKQDTNASIQVRINGGAYSNVTSGTASGSLNLNVGINTIDILITAQDSSTTTYTITVTRSGSNNAQLSSLTISSGTLTPAFSTNIYAYTTQVATNVTSFIVTSTASQSNASISVNSQAVVSGEQSQSINLNVGSNLITIDVTAQDGITIKNYSVTVTRAALAVPTNTVITNNTDKVSISWNSVVNAEKYYIYRSTSSSGTYDELANVTGTSYNDTSATPLTFYYYKVRAWSTASGYSDYTASYSGYILLSTPINVQASDGLSDKVSISWDAVSNAEKYDVYRSTTQSSGYTLLSTVSTTSCDDTTATPGVKYYYQIKAYTVSGVYSAFSNFDTGYKDIADPTAITATDNIIAKKIEISWTAINGANRYDIYRSDTELGAYTKIGNSTASNYSDTSMNFETTYYYKIQAYASSANVYSEYSNYDSGKCRFSYPSNVTATKGTYTDKIQITWTAFTGSESYYVSRATTDHTSTYSYTIIGNTTGTSYNDTTAEPGTVYYYRVQSWTSINSYSDYSNYSDGYVKYNTPIDIGASEGYLSKIIVKWTPVSDADGYRIYRSSSAFGSYSYWGSSTTNSYTDSSTGTYYYKITALSNSTSESDESTYVKGCSGSTLNAPDNVTASEGASSSQISLSWSSVSGASSGYTVYRSTSANGDYSQIGGTTDTSYTDYVSGGSTYYYKIKSSNGSSSGFSIYARGSTN